MATRIVLAALLSTLSACGGGGDGSSTPTAAECRPQVVHIAIFGDSTAWGQDGTMDPNSANPQAPSNPAAALQVLLDRRFGPGAAVVENRAERGTTSTQLLAKIGGPLPSLSTVNHGINDSYYRTPIDAYKANLRALAPAVLVTPGPVTSPAYAPAPYAAAMREVAAETSTPLADVDAYVRALPGWGQYLADGVHPSNELYALIARDVLAPAVMPLVAARRCSAL